ncbi:unnamed protein product [Durusdinium trenchii]|uniref:Uncharacterized protein n=1 Tax=Durusdinium trenchii TaxID=1381693 RepID=A0ABP0IE53_9DINO
MDFAASAGLLTVLEPPLFEALVHNTATQAGAVAPAIIAFTTQHHAEYQQPGENRLRIRFPHLDMLAPAGPQGSSEETFLEAATQSHCGRIVKEIWSEGDGFPMPKGCYYQKDSASGAYFREYTLIFSDGALEIQMIL